MESHKITGVSIDVVDNNLTINLFDCIPPEHKNDASTESPFSSFSIHQESFVDLVALLVRTGINIQSDTGIDLNLPSMEDIKGAEINE